ncbi:MAG: DNA-protecting protein DprA, partial [Neisseriaceae bacterium]|nr:DNA-protecting protein DprA [Neisseriaceae bacterium]
PRRNRLIAALGLGTVVIEAAEKSGSLITARLAGELGRDVMALPGSILNPQAAGCHKLIRDGAALVTSVADILAECEHALQSFRQPENNTIDFAQSENKKSFRQPENNTMDLFQSSQKIENKQPENKNKKPFRQPEKTKTLDLSPQKQEDTNRKIVLDAMGFDPTHPDHLAQRLNLHPADLYAILLDLELDGKIATTQGGFYQRLQ